MTRYPRCLVFSQGSFLGKAPFRIEAISVKPQLFSYLTTVSYKVITKLVSFGVRRPSISTYVLSKLDPRDSQASAGSANTRVG